ncbi:hypothetical protein MSG28_001725 [Choristoneura fumiferana]|uniref:Uncharacterized protein n=1 Tax=Choristoneura fumiferana TaxID=7141 RepID=A0ACC0KVK4_CHOFU|nr:hypothetical protein MSG28_001725 [Choristoneura fumiferana]
MLGFGSSNAFGILFHNFFTEQGSGSGLPLVIGVYNGALSISGFLSGIALKRYSFRQVGLVGAGLFVLGDVLTIFVQRTYQLVFTFGVVRGAGFGVMIPVSFTAFNCYFTKRRTAMMSANQTMSSMASITFPILVTYLLAEYGFRWTLALIMAVDLHLVFAMLVMHPVEWHLIKNPDVCQGDDTEVKEKLPKRHESIQKSIIKMICENVELDLLKDPRFVSTLVGLGFAFVSDMEVATCVMVGAIADLVARFLLAVFTFFYSVDSRKIFFGGTCITIMLRIALVSSSDLWYVFAVTVVSGIVRCSVQALAALGTVMLNCGVGATAGFSAILIPQLKHGKNKLGHHINTEMESWVAAAASFALIFGNMISGYLMERYGRRTSQIMLSFPFMVGWAIIGFANNIYLILLGRFITGFCQGWLGPLGSVFVGEISSPLNRSFFLAGLSLAIAFGVFMSHLFGTLMHWKYAAFLCGLFPLIGCVLTYCVKESPTWLASKNRIEDCVTSFQWYRGISPEMKDELDKIIFEQSQKDQSKSKWKTLMANIKKPEFWKPLCIMIVFFVLTQLTGVNVICAYTTEMMKELIGHNANSDTAMLSVDILRCISLVVACYLLRRLGRRPMAIFSGTSTCLTLIVLSGYLYLDKIHVIRRTSPIITLGLIAIYIIVSNFGVVPLPWNMVGELFATETKGIGSGLSVMTTSVAYFGTIKTAPAMFKSIGHHGTYLFYGISTLLGTVFLYFCLPETKGKTLLEIEEYFRHGKKRKMKSEPNNVIV